MYVPGFFKIDISHDDIDRFFIVLMIYKHVPCFFFKVSPPFFSNDRWYRLAKSFAFWKFGTQNQRHIGGAGYTQFIQQRHIIVWWCCSWNYLNPIIYLTPQRWNTFSSLQKTFASIPPFFWFSWVFKSISKDFFFFFLGTSVIFEVLCIHKVQWFFFS